MEFDSFFVLITELLHVIFTTVFYNNLNYFVNLLRMKDLMGTK